MFADIIKDLEMKSTWIRVGPKSNDKPLYQKRTRNRYTDKERKKPEDRGRDWSDASTSQGTPGAARCHHGLKSSPLSLQGEPCQDLNSGILTSRIVKE